MFFLTKYKVTDTEYKKHIVVSLLWNSDANPYFSKHKQLEAAVLDLIKNTKAWSSISL